MESPKVEQNVHVDGPDRESIKDMIEVAVAPVRSDLKWMRWITAALAAATASPKLGGPELPGAVIHTVQALAKFWG